MIACVLTLIKTLLEIAFLRKGPEAIPRSMVLLTFVTALWLVIVAISAASYDSDEGIAMWLDLVLAAVGVGLYVFMIFVFDKSDRLLQAVTAILGCNAVISSAAIIARYVLVDIMNVESTIVLSELMLLWSILIEGHIIARTIERQWMLGIVMAIAVFIAQLQVLFLLRPMLGLAT